MVDVPELQSLRSRCFLKGSSALGHQMRTHPYAVSGERLCTSFAEGVSFQQASTRQGIKSALAWQTSFTLRDSFAEAARARQLLPAAGTDQWASEAAEVFRHLGFVAVLGVLDGAQLQELRFAATAAAEAMLASDPERKGNRGPRRYSYGGASPLLHVMNVHPWSQLVDLKPIHQILAFIFPDGFLAAGGGGDFVLGETDTYQSLHTDLGQGSFYKFDKPPAVGVNYLVEDLACAGGPLRVVPGTHRLDGAPPVLWLEPQEAKDAVLCPLPAGTAIVRDLRAWHGGTPNALTKTRYMPNAEFVNAQWGPKVCGLGGYLDPCSPVLPHVAHQRLSPLGQAVAAGIVDKTGMLQEVRPSDESWMIPDFPQFSRHNQDAY